MKGVPTTVGIMKGGVFVGDFSPSVKRHTIHEITDALHLIRSLVGQGLRISDAVRATKITDVTYYRWRRKYEGLSDYQIENLVALEAENARLRHATAELSLDKRILLEISKERLSTAALRRVSINQVRATLGISERRACLVLGQHRSTQRKIPKKPIRLGREGTLLVWQPGYPRASTR